MSPPVGADDPVVGAALVPGAVDAGAVVPAAAVVAAGAAVLDAVLVAAAVLEGAVAGALVVNATVDAAVVVATPFESDELEHPAATTSATTRTAEARRLTLWFSVPIMRTPARTARRRRDPHRPLF
jgi:hypothetical protein